MRVFGLMKLSVLALAAVLVLNAGSAQAAWTLIDDFEGLTAGTTIDGTVGPGATWDGGGTVVYTAEADPSDAGNLAMQVSGGAGNQALRAQFSSASSNIAAGATGTLYYRFRTPVAANGGVDSVVALTDNAAVSNFNFKSGLRNTVVEIADPTGGRVPIKVNNIDARNGSSYESLSALEDDTWYSLWMVSANTDPGTHELYLQSATDPAYAAQTKLATAAPDDVFDYRINGPTDIINAYFRGASNGAGIAGNDVYYDDVWMNGNAADLSIPQIPEPTALVLLVSGMGLLLTRRR